MPRQEEPLLFLLYLFSLLAVFGTRGVKPRGSPSLDQDAVIAKSICTVAFPRSATADNANSPAEGGARPRLSTLVVR